MILFFPLGSVASPGVIRVYTKKLIMALDMSCHHLSALDISFGCAPFKPAILQTQISSSYV